MMDPAREVGGDLYDFYETDDGVFCFFIGDVSGKGVAAALFMARTKSLIRLTTQLLRGANGSPPTPADIVTTVNRDLCQDNDSMMFVTLFFGMLDPRTGDLRFTNAGHNPPYRLSRQNVAPIEGSKGRPLGARGNSAYETGHLVLAPGEMLYLYTDGITEAGNKKDNLFGEERLEAVLRATAGHRPDEMIKAVADAVRGFVDGAPQSDDIAALALRRV